MTFSRSVMGRGVGHTTTNPLGFVIQPSEKTLAESIERMQKAETQDQIDFTLLTKAQQEMAEHDYANACGYFEEFANQVKKVYPNAL